MDQAMAPRGFFSTDDHGFRWFDDNDGQQWFVYQGQDIWGVPALVTHVMVEEGVTRILAHAFQVHDTAFDSLENVRIAKTVTHISAAAFYSCQNMVKVEIPKDSQLIEIEDSALRECCSLGEITLPASLRNIGQGAFYNCSALREVNLSHCTLLNYIPARAFRSCNMLETLQLPPNLETIQPNAFHACSSIKEVIFPATLKDIQVGAFTDCTSLSTVKFQSMRAVTSGLGLRWVHLFQAPFHGCKMLQKVLLPENDEAALSKKKWPDLLPLFWSHDRYGLGLGCTEEQKVGLIFSFLRPRMNELVTK